MSRIWLFIYTVTLGVLALTELIQGEVDGSLRLLSDNGTLNGTNYTRSGRLEIFLSGRWGTVCNDSFGEVDATLACNQLGYSSLFRLFTAGTQGAPLALSNTPIWLSGVDCSGPGDLSIINCPRHRIVSSACNHDSDVALSCTAPYSSSMTPGSIRLVPITSYYRSHVSYTTGRVEVFYNGQWGTVCSHNVNKVTADALCAKVTGEENSLALVYGTNSSRELGRISTSGSKDMPIWLQFTCPTSSGPCQMTPHSQGGSCTHSEDLALSCAGDGAVRLTSSSSPSRGDVGGSVGRLEIYQDGEWRSVCDSGFSVATAVCLQLGYMPRHIYIDDYATVSEVGIPSGSGSIWQGRASGCGSDELFIECQRRGTPRTCDHSDYVAISCTGPFPGSGRLDPGAEFILTFLGSIGLVFCVLTATILPITYFCCRRFNKPRPRQLIDSGAEHLPRHTHAMVSTVAENAGTASVHVTAKSTPRFAVSQDELNKTSRTVETKIETDSQAGYPQHEAELHEDEAPPSYDVATAYPLARDEASAIDEPNS